MDAAARARIALDAPRNAATAQNEIEAYEACGVSISHKPFNPLLHRERCGRAFKSHRNSAAVCAAAIARCGHHFSAFYPIDRVEVGTFDLALHQQIFRGRG